jgi:hypothetical protein
MWCEIFFLHSEIWGWIWKSKQGPRERGAEGDGYGEFQTSLTPGVNTTRIGVLLNTYKSNSLAWIQLGCFKKNTTRLDYWLCKFEINHCDSARTRKKTWVVAVTLPKNLIGRGKDKGSGGSVQSYRTGKAIELQRMWYLVWVSEGKR